MLGTVITAGAGLASGILGAFKSAKARRAQNRAVSEQQSRDAAWYNRNYYGNYLDSTMATAALKRVEDTMRRKNEANRAAAIVNGATPEASLAAQEQENEAIGNVAENLAAQADAQKMQVDAMQQQNERNTTGMTMQQRQADEAGASQLMNNGMGLLGTALTLYDGWKSNKSNGGV